MRFHVLRGLPLLASELSKNWRFFACFIALFPWLVAHLNCSDMSWSFEEIVFFFLIKPLLCILCNNPPVIHGARFLLILFFILRSSCLSIQLTNICFHSCHMSFGSQQRSTFDHGICSSSLESLFFLKCLKNASFLPFVGNYGHDGFWAL